MELFEYEQHCRICLKARNASKNVFTHIVEGCQEPLVQTIFSLFKIELHSHSAYPQFVCRKCLTELENILLFKEDLLRNQEFLLNLFRATYPNYVEKKASDSRKIYNSNSSTSTNLTPSNNSGYLKVQEGCFQNKINTGDNTSETDYSFSLEPQATSEARVYCKYCNASFKLSHALQDHYSDSHCLEQESKEESTLNNVWKQLATHQALRTDENRNVSEMQLEQTNDENGPSLKNDAFPRDPDTDEKPPALDIPQASFLQNLDLITLEDAEMLKTRQTLPNRTRRKFISRKFKTLNRGSTGIPKTRNAILKQADKSTALSKKLSFNEDFMDLFKRRSANFLSRYGSRNLNYACLKRGKIQKRAESRTRNIYQRRKNVNMFVSKATDLSKIGRSSLGPRSLDKLEAVPKEKGCDTNLGNRKYSRINSSSKLQLKTVSSADAESDCLITDVKRENKPRRTKSTIKLIGNNECLPSPIISSKSLGEYRPILPNSFYRSVTTRNKKALLDSNQLLQNHLLRNNQYSEDFSNYNNNSGMKNSLRNRNGLKLKLFRSPSLNSRLGSENQTEKDVWSIGDSTTSKEYDFRKRLQVPSEKSANNLKSLKSPKKNKRCKSFDKSINNSFSEVNNSVSSNENPENLSARIGKPKSSSTSQNSGVPRRTRSQLERINSNHDTRQGVDTNTIFIPTKINPDLKRKRGSKKLTRSNNSITPVLDFEKNESSENIKIDGDEALKTIMINGHRLKNEYSSEILSIDNIKEEFCFYDENINVQENDDFQVHNGNPLVKKNANHVNCNEVYEIPIRETLKMKDIKQEILAEQDGFPTRNLRSRSCENLNFLKYDTQEADDIIYTDVLRKFDSIQNVNNHQADKNQLITSTFLNKVHNVNVDEGQEFHLTLTHRNFMIDSVPEDIDNVDLSEYPSKSLILIENSFESRCDKRAKSSDFLRAPKVKRQKGAVSSRSSERLKRSLGDETSGKYKDNVQLSSGSANATKVERNPLVKNNLKTNCSNKKRSQLKPNPVKISTLQHKKRKDCSPKSKATKEK